MLTVWNIDLTDFVNCANFTTIVFFSLCASGKSTERVTILKKVLEHLGVSSLVVLQQNGILMDGIDLEQAKKDAKQ